MATRWPNLACNAACTVVTVPLKTRLISRCEFRMNFTITRVFFSIAGIVGIAAISMPVISSNLIVRRNQAPGKTSLCVATPPVPIMMLINMNSDQNNRSPKFVRPPVVPAPQMTNKPATTNCPHLYLDRISYCDSTPTFRIAMKAKIPYKSNMCRSPHFYIMSFIVTIISVEVTPAVSVYDLNNQSQTHENDER